MRSPAAFQVWLERFGDDPPHVAVTEAFTLLAVCDEAAAVQIAGMPFLDDAGLGHEFAFNDQMILEALVGLARADLDSLTRVLSHPELQGGITDASTAPVLLLALGQEDPAAAAAIRALPWVADGITNPKDAVTYGMRDVNYYQEWPYKAMEDETRHVVRLVWMVERAPGSFRAFMDIPWVRDGYGWTEYYIIEGLSRLAYRDDESTARILRMPFLETPGGDDGEILSLLSNSEHEGALAGVLSSPRLEGGIKDDHLAEVTLAYVETQDRDAAAALDGLAWVRDGVHPSEQEAVLALAGAAVESPPLLRALLAADWVWDGLTQAESRAVRSLTLMARPRLSEPMESTALRVLDMPFLRGEITSLDALAVTALYLLGHAVVEGTLQKVLSHPELRSGITDEWTDRVAVLYLTNIDHTLPDTVLDPEQTSAEKRVVTLPHTGEVTLHVIEPRGPGASSGGPMDLLEHAVRTHEEFMGLPFPERDPILFITGITRARGAHFGNGLFTSASRNSASTIAHEAAHTWRLAPGWLNRPVRWMVEGGAQFLTYISEKARTGAPLPEAASSCSLANNISELVELELDPDVIYQSACNYRLGEGLFLELYDRLGDTAFRQGFRNLHLVGTGQEGVEDAQDECTGDDAAVCYFKAVFLSGMAPEQSAVAEEIIDRRYYGR